MSVTSVDRAAAIRPC